MTTPHIYDANDAVVSLTPTSRGITLTIAKSDGPYDREVACTLSASVLRTLLADAAVMRASNDEDIA